MHQSAIFSVQATALNDQRAKWKVLEDCLRDRDARATKMLLLFENAEDAQGTPQAAQVTPAEQTSHANACRVCLKRA